MDLPIRNLEDLRGEIARLKVVEYDQGIAIGQRFNSPSALLGTLMSLFRGNANPDGTKNSFFDQDLVGLISRFVLPFTLNKTLFRNSGFIIKSLVGLASQKASHFINEDVVFGLWHKVQSLFKGKSHEEEHAEHTAEHKGVPPLSETY
jgi:hypothetical protein